jgi:hypothetical protein
LEAFSFNNHQGISSFNPCSYAFVVKQDQFNFSSHYLYTLKDNTTLPMVLDMAGYDGNSHLPDGCQGTYYTHPTSLSFSNIQNNNNYEIIISN